MRKVITQHSIKVTLICLLVFTGIQQTNAQSGYALNLNGSGDYAELSNSINLSASSFTLECWFKLTNGNNNTNRLITIGNGSNANYMAAGISVRDDNGLIEYFFYGDDASYSSTANDGKWHHVAFSFDNTTKNGILYYDGVNVSNKTFGGNLMASGKARIGSRIWDDIGDFYKGSIDEVRIWKTARTASQIQANRFQAVAITTSGLLAYYNCNAGSGNTLADATSNNYVGSLQGSTSWEASTANLVINHPGNALNFDGINDYAELSGSINLSASSFTLESWFKLTNGNNNRNRIITLGNGSSGDYNAAGISISDKNGLIEYFFYGDNGSYSSTANDGKWHHIAFTFDNSTKNGILYLDGANVANKTFGGNLAVSGQARIGRSTWGWNGSGGDYFKGSIDEVRIWNNARTAAQIQANINNVTDPLTSGLVAYYRFDEANTGGTNTNATILSDLTYNRYNGTLTNFGLSGSSSNWVESYAMVLPTTNAATSITGTSFTANWKAPSVGTVDNNYLLDVSTSSSFSSFVSGYNGISVASTSQSVTGLVAATTYYYRVRADKTSVTGQGGYSSTITTTTLSNNANLSALSLSSGTLSPTFASGTTNYIASVPNTVSNIMVTPTVSPANATIQAKVNGGSYSSVTNGNASGSLSLNVGSNIINVLVTAQDGTTTKTYTITVIRAAIPPGNCLNFDGINDYAELSGSINLSASSFTLESWFKLTNGNNNRNRIITLGNGSSGDYNAAGISISDKNGLIEYFFYGDNGSYSSTANDGKWHHIAFTFDNSTKNGILYLDGANVANKTFGGNLAVSGQARIGRSTWGWNGSGGDYFKGLIDEVRIWNIARTSTQIQSNMFNTISGNSTGLVAYYNFDDGTAGGSNSTFTTLYDQTANAYNGTLTNFGLSGSTSNWVESYGMVVPTAIAATNIAGTSFTANWKAPTVGTVDNGYRLDVSITPGFSSLVSGYNGLSVSGTSKSVTGLTRGVTYYYRVRADKTSVTNQGAYSNVITTSNCTSTSSSSSLSICANQLPYSWNGLSFTGAGTKTKAGLVNAFGCDSSATLTVTISSPVTPSVTISTTSDTVCNNVAVTFIASSSTGGTSPIFNWQKNGTSLSSGSSITLPAGTLTTGDAINCVLTANNACQTTATATSNTRRMYVNISPAIGTSTGFVMCTIGATAGIYNTNPGSGVWSSSNTNVATVTTVSGSTGSVKAIGNGTAILTFTKTEANGCKSSAPATVVVAAVPTPANISGTNSICVNSSSALSNTTAGGVWSVANNRATITAAGIVTGANEGNAIIYYTVTNANGCSNMTSKNIAVNATPGIPTINYAGSINPQTGPGGSYCTNKTFTYSGNPSGGVWSKTGVITVGASSGVVNTGSIAGSATLTYTYTNSVGCSNSNTTNINVSVCAARGVNSVNKAQSKIKKGQ